MPLHFVASQTKCNDKSKSSFIVTNFNYQEAVIMSLKTENQYETDEIKPFSELEWLATLSVTATSFAPYIADIFG